MTQHIATAAVVKVSIGSLSGNRVAAFIQRGGVVPEGVAEEQLKRLVDRGLIEEVAVEAAESEEITLPTGDPSEEWSGKQLDKFAADLGIDLGGAKNKAEKVAAIAAATKK
jgi:hypothetical protein